MHYLLLPHIVFATVLLGLILLVMLLLMLQVHPQVHFVTRVRVTAASAVTAALWRPP